MDYVINTNVVFKCGFSLDPEKVHKAIQSANDILNSLPASLFRSIDYKTTSATIGCIFCEAIASQTEGQAIVNPIEKGHPDIIPAEAVSCTEEELRNYPEGLEIMCTIASIPNGVKIEKAHPRIDYVNKVVWQAHHREVTELLGITYDYFQNGLGYKPQISGLFYSSELCRDDWGKISGISGRNTKVSSMLASGRNKMGTGWVAILNQDKYLQTYKRTFHIQS